MSRYDAVAVNGLAAAMLLYLSYLLDVLVVDELCANRNTHTAYCSTLAVKGFPNSMGSEGGGSVIV